MSKKNYDKVPQFAEDEDSAALEDQTQDELHTDSADDEAADATPNDQKSGQQDAISPSISTTSVEELRTFEDVRCKEKRFSIIFFLIFLGVAVLETIDLGEHPPSNEQTFLLVIGSFLSCLYAVICLVSWIYVTLQLLWATQLFSISFGYVFTIMLVFSTHYVWGAIFTLMTLSASYWLFKTMRHNQLQFARVVLEMIADLVRANPALITLVAVILILQTLWISYWCMAAVQAQYLKAHVVAYLYLFFALYWTSQVFKHIIHFVVCGTVGHWYFRKSSGQESAQMTATCLRRAVTTSFGSVCRGSLFITIVRFLWGVIRRIVGDSENWLTTCLCERLYYNIESWFHHYNKYAFTQVAVYGKDFRQAAHDTWTLFDQRGVDSIIYADKLDILLLLPAFGGGCFVATVCGIWALHLGLVGWHIVALVCFWVGFCTINLTTELIEASLASILACFAEESGRLQDTHPILFHRLVRISEFGNFNRFSVV